MRISATAPQFFPNFFRILSPIIQLRPKISHSRHQVSHKWSTGVTVSKKYNKQFENRLGIYGSLVVQC
jgi:hypothetical protein